MITKTKHKIFLNASGAIFYNFCQWLMTIISVKTLGYEASGYLGLAMTMSSTFSAITLFGMRNYQVSDASNEYEDSIYFSSRIITCIVSLAFCVFASFFVGDFYQVCCIAALMIIRVTEGLVDVLHGINQKYDRYDIIGISFLLRGFVTISSFSVALFIGENLFTALAFCAFLNMLVCLLFDCKGTLNTYSVSIHLLDERIAVLLKKCFPIVIFYFLLSAENLMCKKVILNIYGQRVQGIYSSLSGVLVGVQMLFYVAFLPILPAFSEAIKNEDKRGYRRMLHRLYRYIILLAVTIFAFFIFVGKKILFLLLNYEIIEYEQSIFPMTLCSILLGCVWIESAIMISLRKMHYINIGMIISFILGIIFVYPMIKCFGINGANVTLIICYGVLVLYFGFKSEKL